jgi:hypothetical protein
MILPITTQLGKTIAGGTPGTPLKPPGPMKLTRATVVAVNQVINGVTVTTVRLPGSKVAVPVEVTVGNNIKPGDVVEVATSNGRVIILGTTSNEVTPPTSEITLTSRNETLGFGPFLNLDAISPGPQTGGEFEIEAQSPSAIFSFFAVPDGWNSGFNFPFGPSDLAFQKPIGTPPFLSSIGGCNIPLYNHGPNGAQFNAGFGTGTSVWFCAVAGGGHVLQYPTVQPPFNVDVAPPSGPFGPGSLEVHTFIWATSLDYTSSLSAGGIRTYDYAADGILIGTYPFQLPETDFGVIFSAGDLSLDTIGIANSGATSNGIWLVGCTMSCQGLTPSGSVWPVSFS